MNLLRRVPFLREAALLARRFANAVLDDEDAASVGQTDLPGAPETDEPPARQGPPAHWLADIAAKAPHLVQDGELSMDAFSNFDLRVPVIETESAEPQQEEKRPEIPKGVTLRREHATSQRKNDPPRQTDVRPLPKEVDPKEQTSSAPRKETSGPGFSTTRPPQKEENHAPIQDRSSFTRNTSATKESATKESATKESATKESATPKVSPRIALPRASNDLVQHSAPSTRSVAHRENPVVPTVTPSFALVSKDEPSQDEPSSVLLDDPHETNVSTVARKTLHSPNAPRKDPERRFVARAPMQEVVQDVDRFSPAMDETQQISRHLTPPRVFEAPRMLESQRMPQRLAEIQVDTSNPHVAPELHQAEPPVLFVEPERDVWPALPSQEHFGATHPAFMDLEIFADRAVRLDKEQRGDW